MGNKKLPDLHWLGKKKAQRNGRNFEDMIREQCKFQQILVVKNHVPTIMTRRGLKYLSKGEPDFNIGFQGVSVYFDAKNFDSDRITYSQLVPHQISRLAEIKAQGFNAGYLVWLRQIGHVVWIPVSDLLSLSPGKSLRIDQMTIIGSASSTWLEPEISFGRLFSLDWETRRCAHCKKAI